LALFDVYLIDVYSNRGTNLIERKLFTPPSVSWAHLWAAEWCQCTKCCTGGRRSDRWLVSLRQRPAGMARPLSLVKRRKMSSWA